MVDSKISNLLGLAMRAGNIVSGEETCKKELKKSLYLVIVAEDASNNTKKVFSDKCSYYNVPLKFMGTKDALGHCIGKTSRATIGIKDKKLATVLLNCMNHIDICP
ncbi:L7Ae/L30e/S12e/Gadd45 family ribosomal protein [Clostridium formicaceticum]|uniref:50S ribosomal protein L7 n=1 Tax=Clostridium formicaceticum TaxID=1497 RepID=A0AAC9RP77_9CLOT|nr:ribosomal L7Ae/L30e/S12e/Gadd45 family protein [Clostridium formicaceticum]AOY77275.1 50S ribosomal protein L7 [Clostridium formicaceticum]ARE87815.1 putative ribosomal protein YlxQ [Clostridium formicaceticum]